MCARPSLLRDQRGATAVEFALVGPLFFAFLFGIIQFGIAMNGASSVRHALVAESRALALNPSMTADQLQSAVRHDVASLTSNTIRVSMNHRSINGVSAAVATASYAGSIAVPFMGSYPLNFSSTVTVPLPQT